MSDPDKDETIPPPLASARPAASVRVDASGLSDRGKVRADNQDHFYLGRMGRFSEVLATSLPPGTLIEHLEETGYVGVVADGMGGHAGGEVASRTRDQPLLPLPVRDPRLGPEGRRRERAEDLR
jgi:serine/threonine protein phosphatase PrpC